MTNILPKGSGLAGTYNYVRDAVKVVVNAYTGKMSFYVIAPKDPLIRAYEAAFPGLFRPLSAMSPVLQAHLRYPQDLTMVQADMYGRYHIESPAGFYSLSDAWDLSQTSNSASGSPSSQLARANGSVARYTPVYELLQLPGQAKLTFDAVEPLVPFSSNDNLQTLRSIFVADSDASSYGKLDAYVAPGESVHGPALANADINANPTISKAITLLDSRGSTVSLGTVQILPIADSLIYVRPLYVSSSQTPFPQLVDVVVVYGKHVAMEPTLSGALGAIFGGAPATTGPSGKGKGGKTTVPAQARRPRPGVRRVPGRQGGPRGWESRRLPAGRDLGREVPRRGERDRERDAHDLDHDDDDPGRQVARPRGHLLGGLKKARVVPAG